MNNSEWKTYYIKIFLNRFLLLKDEVKQLKEKKPTEAKTHPKTKLFLGIVRVLKEIQQDPTKKEYHLGNTLSKKHTDWKRAKDHLPDRYRLFFKYFSPEKNIFIAWINDEKTLRKKGAATDCYKVFQRKLSSKKIPSEQYKLLDISSRF